MAKYQHHKRSQARLVAGCSDVVESAGLTPQSSHNGFVVSYISDRNVNTDTPHSSLFPPAFAISNNHAKFMKMSLLCWFPIQLHRALMALLGLFIRVHLYRVTMWISLVSSSAARWQLDINDICSALITSTEVHVIFATRIHVVCLIPFFVARCYASARPMPSCGASA